MTTPSTDILPSVREGTVVRARVLGWDEFYADLGDIPEHVTGSLVKRHVTMTNPSYWQYLVGGIPVDPASMNNPVAKHVLDDCPKCRRRVTAADARCPSCGTVLIEDIDKHGSKHNEQSHGNWANKLKSKFGLGKPTKPAPKKAAPKKKPATKKATKQSAKVPAATKRPATRRSTTQRPTTQKVPARLPRDHRGRPTKVGYAESRRISERLFGGGEQSEDFDIATEKLLGDPLFTSQKGKDLFLWSQLRLRPLVNGRTQPRPKSYRAAVRALVKDVDDQWVNTAGDHDRVAIALQLSARKEFGLDEADIKHFGDMLADGQQLNQRSINHPQSRGLNRDKAQRKIHRAIYEANQERMREAGLDALPVGRGMTLDEEQAKALGLKIYTDFDELNTDLQEGRAWQRSDMTTQPMSSFSVDPEQTTAFSTNWGQGDWDPDEVSILIRGEVPREWIYSMGKAGVGSWHEREAIVLGGRHEFEVLAFKHSAQRGWLRAHGDDPEAGVAKWLWGSFAPADLDKHLPGQHNQKTHGRRGSAKPKLAGLNTARAKLQEMMEQKYKQPPRPNRTVVSQPISRFFSAEMHEIKRKVFVNDEAQQYQDFHRAAYHMADDPEIAAAYGFRPDDTKDQIASSLYFELLKLDESWVGTSGDTDAFAIHYQILAQQEFGIDDATLDHLGRTDTDVEALWEYKKDLTARQDVATRRQDRLSHEHFLVAQQLTDALHRLHELNTMSDIQELDDELEQERTKVRGSIASLTGQSIKLEIEVDKAVRESNEVTKELEQWQRPFTYANAVDLANNDQGHRKLMRGLYGVTQERLEAYDTIPVVRGMSLPRVQAEAMGLDPANPTWRAASVTLQPLSAFSFSEYQAHINFSSARDVTHVAVVLRGYVPRSSVFSIGDRGVGSFNEDEIVLLGGQHQFEVIALDNNAYFKFNTRDVFDAEQGEPLSSSGSTTAVSPLPSNLKMDDKYLDGPDYYVNADVQDVMDQLDLSPSPSVHGGTKDLPLIEAAEEIQSVVHVDVAMELYGQLYGTLTPDQKKIVDDIVSGKILGPTKTKEGPWLS